MQNLLNERQAASYLCLRPATLRQWRSRDYGPSYHRLGGAIRYHMSDLEKFLEITRQQKGLGA